jgi:integrase
MAKRMQFPLNAPFLPFPPHAAQVFAPAGNNADGYLQDSEKEATFPIHLADDRQCLPAPPRVFAKTLILEVSDWLTVNDKVNAGFGLVGGDTLLLLDELGVEGSSSHPRYNTPSFAIQPGSAQGDVISRDSGREYQGNSGSAEEVPSHSIPDPFLAAAPLKECARLFTSEVSDVIAPDPTTAADGEEISHTTGVKRHTSSEPAKPRLSPYISSFLQFPHDSADCLANSRENSVFYMQSEVDESEIQNVHNAYMSTAGFVTDTQDAMVLRDRARLRVMSQASAHNQPRTLADLLATISGRQDLAKQEAMMRTTAGHVTEMLAAPPDEVPVSQLRALVSRFKQYLQGHSFRRNSVRSYLNYLRVLIKVADELGWSMPHPEIPAPWRAIYSVARTRKCGSVVRYAVEHSIEPAAFGDEELERWAEAAMAAGRSYSRTTVVKHLFRKAIFDEGLNTLMPTLTRHRRNTYGVPVRLFPPALRTEVEAMMRFKQAEFVFDAKGRRTRLRAASARTVVQALGRIYGYTVAHGHPIDTLDELVSQATISAFADGCLNERKLRPDPVRCALGAVRAAYAQFRGVDLPWFRNLLATMPRESEKTIVRRKSKKWIDSEVLAEIPAKIRAAAERDHCSGHKLAIMRRDELLMTVMAIIPWRQRNLREAKLGTSADGANIFKESLHPLSTCAKPEWAVAALRANPEEKLWQARFDASETKAHNEIEMILPQDIGALLDEYVQVHRQQLVRGADPGTLFLNSQGRAMTQSRMTKMIGELTLRYAGRRVTPHVLRDIVTVGFLKDRPEQYETAAKILWHSTPAMIRKRYGKNFDESFGAVAAEQWFVNRRKKKT